MNLNLLNGIILLKIKTTIYYQILKSFYNYWKQWICFPRCTHSNVYPISVVVADFDFLLNLRHIWFFHKPRPRPSQVIKQSNRSNFENYWKPSLIRGIEKAGNLCRKEIPLLNKLPLKFVHWSSPPSVEIIRINSARIDEIRGQYMNPFINTTGIACLNEDNEDQILVELVWRLEEISGLKWKFSKLFQYLNMQINCVSQLLLCITIFSIGISCPAHFSKLY